MNCKQIQHIVHGHHKKLKRYGEVIVRGLDPESLHDFRVEYKKLRAFLRMLSADAAADKLLKIPGDLKKAYAFAGVIRDLQLQQQRVLEATMDKPKKPQSYITLLEKEISHVRPKLSGLLKDPVTRESSRKINAYLPTAFPTSRFKSYLYKQLYTIRCILVPGHLSDDTVHRIRKILKDLFYNLSNYEGTERETLTVSFCKGKTEKYFHELLDQLGNFQDQCRSIALLKTSWLEHMGAYNQALLGVLRNKWITDKVKHKQLLLERLKSDFLPQSKPGKIPHRDTATLA